MSSFIFSKKKIFNKKILKYFFYLIWIGIISSINTNSSLLSFKTHNLIGLINFLRAASPIIIFIILIIFIFSKVKNLNFFKENNLINNISLCILFYSFISMFGLFINKFFLIEYGGISHI